MNYYKFVEWFMNFSEKVVAYLINTFFIIVLALPMILVDLMFKESIFKLPLFFIPLVSLYLIALKCTTYSWYSVLTKSKLYYGMYFVESLKDKFFKTYIYYIIATTFLYFGLTSTFILTQEISQWFWILFVFIILAIVPNIIYSTIQFAIYDTKSLKFIVNNSIILSFMYEIFSLGLSIIFSIIVYRFQYNPFIVLSVGIPAFAILLLLVQRIIEKNKKVEA